ncbi:hypothetical protein, partial [uncultured Acetatifactor sp.]|uniref:hypothetical protein n=1 Tax=uncultured Acetatifactor sp. TaxID=1671927 RepID=UPI002615CC95
DSSSYHGGIERHFFQEVHIIFVFCQHNARKTSVLSANYPNAMPWQRQGILKAACLTRAS